MKYRYLIVSLCLSGILAISYGFANDENIKGDCNTTIRGGYSDYNTIYPEKLIEIAQQHLTTYCCLHKKEYLTNQESCKNISSDSTVDSPRLYDHLIDLGMRYLDGDSDLQYPQAPLDTKGKERRDFVRVYGDKPTGGIPLEIQNKYTQYRGNMIEDFGTLDTVTSCETRRQTFEKYNKDRQNISLAKKYFILCEINSCMVDGQKNNRIGACQSLATERIIGEGRYVQGLMLHQSTLALATNFEAYALGYINHDKFNTLLEKIVMMSKGLGFINSKVNEMTKMCSA